LETFARHANFDVESLESEEILRQIRKSKLEQMLEKKPHYAKYFSDEEEKDEQQMASTFASSESFDRKEHSSFQRVESIFGSTYPVSMPEIGTIQSVPRLTSIDIREKLTPFTDEQHLEVALTALEEANLSTVSAFEQQSALIGQRNINLKQFVIEDSIFSNQPKSRAAAVANVEQQPGEVNPLSFDEDQSAV